MTDEEKFEHLKKVSNRYNIILQLLMGVCVFTAVCLAIVAYDKIDKAVNLAHYNAGYAKGKLEVLQEAAKVYAGEYTVDSQSGSTAWKWNVDKTK